VNGYRLGVDLGTSTTVATVVGSDGRARQLLFDASPLLSSAVHASGRGLVVGADAERAAALDPGGFEANPKRRIDDGTVWLGEREIPVAELLTAVLRRVADEATRVGGRAPAEVAVTHPAAWGATRLAVLADAVGRAGLGPVRFVPEPVAAAAYFVAVAGARVPAGHSVVVYDLGAGTFDVSVVRPRGSTYEVLATAGLDDVGGLDLDAVVVAHARATAGATDGGATELWRRLDWPRDEPDRQARQQLWQGARAAKEQLSRHPTAEFAVPLVGARVHLTREEFDRAAHAHLERTATLTRTVLGEARVPPELVAGVFLVGGASRIPLAGTLLHRTLRIAPTVLDHPELVVSEGSLHAVAQTPAYGPAAPYAPVRPAPPATLPPPVPRPAPQQMPWPAPGAAAYPVPPGQPAGPFVRRRWYHNRTARYLVIGALVWWTLLITMMIVDPFNS
jgi:molecular chaperone DnaK (HSP70)